MASNLKKYVIRKLIERAGYTPENLPISLSSSRIMEDYTRNLGPLIPGVPVQKRGESLRLELPKQKRVVSRQTDTSGNTFTSGTLNKFSFDRGDGSNPLFSKVKQLQVYDTALTDTQLAALTS